MEYSEEQHAVINAAKNNVPIACDSISGSGKTTTILGIAAAMASRRVIQVTYNRSLKDEVRQKVVANNVKNLEIHTYHSLAVGYYDRTACDDNRIRALLKRADSFINIPNEFDMLICDEAQDMTPLYFEFIYKFIHDAFCVYKKPINFMVLGDRYQGIYSFKDADVRFLTLASTVWSRIMSAQGIETPMMSLQLKRSYRVTEPIAWFVNNVMLNEPRMISLKKGPPIEYIRTSNIFGIYDKIASIILRHLANGEIEPDDIFVLSASLKSPKAPFRNLEQALVLAGVPCFVSTSDGEKLDDEVLKGKVIFTNFHQCKGRERKLVIIYGFDESYVNFFARSEPKGVCPSTLYVAVTRASWKLILIESAASGPLSFLTKKPETTGGFLRVSEYGTMPAATTATTTPKTSAIHTTSVTQLVSHIHPNYLDFLSQTVEVLWNVIEKPSTSVAIPCKVDTEDEHGTIRQEQVSDLNGIAIPAFWEFQKTKTCSIVNTVRNGTFTDGNNVLSNQVRDFLQKHEKRMRLRDRDPKTAADFLKWATMYWCYRNGLIFKLAQITRYDWLKMDMVRKCCVHLDRFVGIGDDAALRFEKAVVLTGAETDFGTVHIQGAIDIYDETIASAHQGWEIKCVQELNLEHHLQAIVYAWILKYIGAPCKRYNLLNIRTGELKALDTSHYLIDDVMRILFLNKYGPQVVRNDAAFLEMCDGLVSSGYECRPPGYQVWDLTEEFESLDVEDAKNLTLNSPDLHTER
jgi:hypothetical protein